MSSLTIDKVFAGIAAKSFKKSFEESWWGTITNIYEMQRRIWSQEQVGSPPDAGQAIPTHAVKSKIHWPQQVHPDEYG